jgi:pectinesterase
MVAFINCRFSGYQDTLYPHGEKSRQYYRDCTIEGTVDFIFGWSTAVFDRCTILCKDHGYITAPSTNEETPFGLVFLDCKIGGSAPGGSFYLGRPWRPFGKAAFLRCEMGMMIKPEGWHNWGKPEAEQTSLFAEFRNSGAGAATTNRVVWAHQLSEEEASAYTTAKILGDWVLKFL